MTTQNANGTTLVDPLFDVDGIAITTTSQTAQPVTEIQWSIEDALPFPVTMEVLERGQERFNVYCTPCHSRVGNGAGMIVQRGYKPAGNFHDARRLAEPLSHYFYVMTNGYGAMWKYSAQVEPRDRWAIAAYIRVLQASQDTNVNALPADQRSKLPASQAMASMTPGPASPAPATKGAQR